MVSNIPVNWCFYYNVPLCLKQMYILKKKLCWVKFNIRLSSKALRSCPTGPPTTQNPRILKNLGEEADEVYLRNTECWHPQHCTRGDPDPQQSVHLNQVRVSFSEKTPTKPLGQSERPPLAVFLVTILSSTLGKVWHHWQQDVTAGSTADSSCSTDSRSQCSQDHEKMERATPTEQARHVCQTLCSVDSSKPWITLPGGKPGLWELGNLFQSLSLQNYTTWRKCTICRVYSNG